jgi:hypothetical protein
MVSIKKFSVFVESSNVESSKLKNQFLYFIVDDIRPYKKSDKIWNSELKVAHSLASNEKVDQQKVFTIYTYQLIVFNWVSLSICYKQQVTPTVDA